MEEKYVNLMWGLIKQLEYINDTLLSNDEISICRDSITHTEIKGCLNHSFCHDFKKEFALMGDKDTKVLINSLLKKGFTVEEISDYCNAMRGN